MHINPDNVQILGIFSFGKIHYTNYKFKERAPGGKRGGLRERRKEDKDMLTFIFLVLFFSIFGGILKFALKATWGITKIVFGLIVLPLVLLALLIGGLVTFALPILIIVGIVFLIKALVKAN